MRERLEAIKNEAIERIASSETLDALEEIRVRTLGRKGALTEILRGISQAPPEERPTLGQAANEVKNAVSEALETRKESIESSGAGATGAPELDWSLPGRRPAKGRTHLVLRTSQEIVDIFREMGFQLATGPDVETEYYNFDALNTPESHPARDSHDTFFVEPGVVLRTHTSPVQMRTMEQTRPPVAVVAPGRVYRVDSDASHSPMFYQIEGLLVDEGVSMADLRGTITLFLRRLFGQKLNTRFRPHFFPFTEPSAEVDMSCTVCGGEGCRTCKHSGWIEIMGCGMVHPEVFRYAGYDSERYTGFAFGMGVDRIAMLRHAIDSIHHLYENDLRFLEQF
jgi:phenylalanyl-tRNA synthetase alpha chain